MKKYIIFLLIFNLFLVSCSKEENIPDPQNEQPDQQPTDPDPDGESEPPTPVTYFTFRDNNPFREDINGLYILIHDDQGTLLDYKAYENEVTLNFESTETISEKLSVTVIKRNVDNLGNTTYELTTTQAVQNGSEWILEPSGFSDYPTPGNTGNFFTATINGVPRVNGFWRTNTIFELGGGASSTTYAGGITDMTIDLGLYEEYSDYYITILDGTNQLKYLRHSYDGTNIVVDYEELEDPVAQYEVNLPENHSFYWLEVAGFPEDIPYHDYYGGLLQRSITGLNPDVPTQPLVFGYPSGFERFRTVLSTRWDNKAYLRIQYGPALNGLNIPNPSFIIDNPLRNRFLFNTDVPYETARNTWRFDAGDMNDGTYIGTIWHTDVPSASPNIVGDLPQEILDALPELEIEELEYSHTTLKFSLEGGETLSRNELTIYNY